MHGNTKIKFKISVVSPNISALTFSMISWIKSFTVLGCYMIIFRRKILTDEIDETGRKRRENKKLIMNLVGNVQRFKPSETPMRGTGLKCLQRA